MTWSVIKPATSRSQVRHANHSATLPHLFLGAGIGLYQSPESENGDDDNDDDDNDDDDDDDDDIDDDDDDDDDDDEVDDDDSHNLHDQVL
ncbi:hypothetical protein ElyMa_003224500 [Elysia marginata]|uniref:Uncharacterized protein n=1 Tax=Elysia marginata TaxID=1093978 RepID=A0AAV4J4E4_9GAST|nr:hypothetical protein ElyMa_003224500 [Elysia marginata]